MSEALEARVRQLELDLIEERQKSARLQSPLERPRAESPGWWGDGKRVGSMVIGLLTIVGSNIALGPSVTALGIWGLIVVGTIRVLVLFVRRENRMAREINRGLGFMKVNAESTEK